MEQIDPRLLLVKISRILNDLSIPYIITGGLAVLVWGRPRFTADIDVVIGLEPGNIDQLKAALDAISDTGYVDKHAIEDAVSHQGEFNYLDGKTGLKVDFWVSKKQDPFDISRLKRRVGKKILDKQIYFTSPEDLILIKLKWYKESKSSRQIEDVESIFQISGETLDMAYLQDWAKRLSVSEILERVVDKKEAN